MENITGADMVLEALEREGVELIFGYPGGANLPIYQRLPEHPRLRHILVRHEQGAAHMADGFARATGRPGVVFATSGPGALNTVTGLATAYMDSVPMVVVTGQVASSTVGRDAFQESDVIGCTQSVTKHSYLVTHVSQIPRAFKEAFYIATTGRPGPVLIDICKDAQQATGEFDYDFELDLPGYKPAAEPDPIQVERAVEVLRHAQRPVILAGHGVILSGAERELIELAERSGPPCSASARSRPSIPWRCT
jgi:acetolactate synthase-1/2/3 large subunit